MLLHQLLIPEVQAELLRRHGLGLYQQGQAAGFLLKAAAEKGADTPVPEYALAGRLYLSRSGWLLMSVPNALVRGVFDAMEGQGLELPPSGPNAQLNAHATIMTAAEVEKIGPDRISERGHSVRYQLGPIKRVRPAGWDDISVCYFIEIRSPEAVAIRKSYGLTPLPRGDHPLHITVAVRRKNVLTEAPASKLDGAAGR